MDNPNPKAPSSDQAEASLNAVEAESSHKRKAEKVGKKPPPLPAGSAVSTDEGSEPASSEGREPSDDKAPKEKEPRQKPPPQPRRLIGGVFVRGSLSFLLSMVLHFVVLITLALIVIPTIVHTPLAPMTVRNTDQEELRELETVELDQQIEAATEMIFADAGGTPTQGASLDFDSARMDTELVEADVTTPTVDFNSMVTSVARRGELFEEVPGGTTAGRSRSVVDGYGEAMDRITQEIMLALYKGPVLVIWVFDQSESMKDDQQEIRDRIERVYAELGLSDRTKGDGLKTAVTSYGGDFVEHTRHPTSDLEEVRRAISSVPVDPSGEELMCPAVGQSIARYSKIAAQDRRRMLLILVTDESGDRPSNAQYLERTIEQAKAARCKIYVLGREACFGYPYVFFRYKHPQTSRPHWLRVDRGPETAFVEQIQTNGFHRRHDAFPSGYGPYEQSRMCFQTGGIFFLLPSLESKLVRGEKRRYELENMRWYKPDLRAREEIYAERDRFELRSTIWGIICDLNPYDKNSAKVIELRDDWSTDPATFMKQAAREQEKARVYLDYLVNKAIPAIDKIEHLRKREDSLRWQANYDLMRGQLYAYAARVNEFGAYTEKCVAVLRGQTTFDAAPFGQPRTKKGSSESVFLTHYDLGTRKPTLTGDVIKPYVEKSTEILKKLSKDHPGTPWAARAEWELRRGFGVALHPAYEPAYKDVKNPAPLPKL